MVAHLTKHDLRTQQQQMLCKFLCGHVGGLTQAPRVDPTACGAKSQKLLSHLRTDTAVTAPQALSDVLIECCFNAYHVSIFKTSALADK